MTSLRMRVDYYFSSSDPTHCLNTTIPVASPSNHDHHRWPRTTDQQRPTAADEGKSRPTAANDEGGRADNRAQTTCRVVWAQVCFFLYLSFVLTNISIHRFIYSVLRQAATQNRAQTMPDASFGPIGTCFFEYNCFHFLFYLFIYYYDPQHPWNAGQRPPHPPRLQMRAGGGHSQSSDAKHPTPPSSLTNTSWGWVFPSSTIRPMKASRPHQQTKANTGSQQPTQAKPMKTNTGQRRPTAANDGQRRPTQVNAGPQQPRLGLKTCLRLEPLVFFYFFKKLY